MPPSNTTIYGDAGAPVDLENGAVVASKESRGKVSLARQLKEEDVGISGFESWIANFR